MDLQVINVDAPAAITRFGGFQRLTVRQRKRWVEILLSFEVKNAYEVFDEFGQAVLRVQEEGEGLGEFIRRMFLGPLRPFQCTVTDLATGQVVLRLRRPWRWVFHRLEVSSGSNEPLGAIEKRWSWIRRIYSVEDATGQQVADIFGPFLKPWTFEIRASGIAVGAIRKKWSGFGKEMFTDADNFGVDLQSVPDPLLKALAFAATVLLDVVHFERAKR